MTKRQRANATKEQQEIKSQAEYHMTLIETTGSDWEHWNDWADKADDAEREIRRIELSQYQNASRTYNVR